MREARIFKRLADLGLIVVMAAAVLAISAPVFASGAGDYDSVAGFNAPGTFHTGDIAVINNMIANNGLQLTPAPADGSYIPADWGGTVWWDNASPRRIVELQIWEMGLFGNVDVRNLHRLVALIIDGNHLTGINVNGLSELFVIDASRNRLSSLDVRGLTSLGQLLLAHNRLAGLDVRGLNSIFELVVHNNIMNSTSDVLGWQSLDLVLTSIEDSSWAWQYYDMFVFYPQSPRPHLGDIAVINNMIANNGLPLTPAPADGSYIPADWGEIVRWDNFWSPWRIQSLFLTDIDAHGEFDVRGLTGLTSLVIQSFDSPTLITSINVSGLTALESLSVSRAY